MFPATYAAPIRFAAKGRFLLVQRTDFDALLVVEHRAVDRTGDVVSTNSAGVCVRR